MGKVFKGDSPDAKNILTFWSVQRWWIPVRQDASLMAYIVTAIAVSEFGTVSYRADLDSQRAHRQRAQ